jgi:hypothetical protein
MNGKPEVEGWPTKIGTPMFEAGIRGPFPLSAFAFFGECNPARPIPRDRSCRQVGQETARNSKATLECRGLPCLLLALSRHSVCADECPLLGVKRTSPKSILMSANDP